VDPVAENADTAEPRSVGQILAAERERQGLSRADVAQRLHMSAYQVEALETGDFSRLPKGTFLRGFVRNYAKVLGLAPDKVLPLLETGVAADKKPGIVVPTQNIRFDPMSERLQSPVLRGIVIAGVIVALAFAGMYWLFFIRPSPPGAAAARKVVAENPPAAVAAVPKMEAVVRVEAPPPRPLPVEPPKLEAPRKAEVAKPDESAKKPEPVKVAASDGGSTLKFRFKGESWVEIRDGKGRLLLSRLNPAGSEAEVSGRPPFNVVVGNAPDVQMFYNDHEFALEPHTKVAVARFTVE
jgi:cytoskeleton protein RodZ